MLIGLLLEAAVALGTAGPQPTDVVPRVVVTTTVAESVTQRRLDGAVDWPRLQDTLRTRRPTRAVEYSDFYHKRLTLHRYLSFTMLPLFAGSYLTGDQIIRKADAAPKWATDWHAPLATATAAVFTLNTITRGHYPCKPGRTGWRQAEPPPHGGLGVDGCLGEQLGVDAGDEIGLKVMGT